ncbi:hypothetical protein BDV32DRAFT_161711 [Aspergillus pseudonomiae]|uniref:Uncharacterized protein n=1 Tax=Aspergillus pseudonomiae TaxID=1506151 RepID=A0A5N6IAG7_9EURO|nr:uncharacterized protein BDV37DRAFT_238512 [Aspergillus pseudonomiae]KAB8263496.1 hypothetical protein BDV32DRAFT_161711 [Aspergillus pseudonomiae]KAE8408358.1 hypothetical protein BDV37DRAFT_238512 [Aspergillus pseudonomiae]
MATASFTLFPNLPPELRHQIWRYALPDKIRQALYVYQADCLKLKRLKEGSRDYMNSDAGLDLLYEWCPYLLDPNPIKVEVPLLFVSSEARGITLAWMRGQGLKIHSYKAGQTPIAIRPFDPEHDTLYIPYDYWGGFLDYTLHSLAQYDEIYNYDLLGLKRIAVSEGLILDQERISETWLLYCGLEKVFIIPNAQSDMQPEEHGRKVKGRLELHDIQGPMRFWNNDRGCFEWENSADAGDETLKTAMEKACDGLDEWLQDSENTFEVRAASVVRK